jgi:acyl-CoA reductase-like NAD-dependent aldehyde dehydrogenase
LNVVGDAAALRRVIGLTGQFTTVDDLLTGRENLQNLLEQSAPDLQKLMTAEVGAVGRAIVHNLTIGFNNLRDAAGMANRIDGEVIPSNIPGVFTMTVRRPLGVTLGVAPWNGTISLSARSVAMPLACGNTTVMRASELSPVLT